MKFCSQCSGKVSLMIPEGDNCERYVCESCHFIHYENPKIITGCIVFKGDKVLLCKRAIEPKQGWWTVPAGYMENGETTRAGAERETLEESGATVNAAQLYYISNITHVNQVYMLYLADLAESHYHPGTESLEVELFSEDEIPWEQIAFRTVKKALEFYFEDKRTGHFTLREHDFHPEDFLR